MRSVGFKNLSSKNLPYDYQVEWIAGNDERTAYIMLNYSPTSNTKAYLMFEHISGGNGGLFFNIEDSFHNSQDVPKNGKGFGIGWGYDQPNNICRVNYGYGFVSEAKIGGNPDFRNAISYEEEWEVAA